MSDDIILPPNSKAIPLTRGKFAIVDAEDYDWLMQWKWRYNNGYAVRSQYISCINGKKTEKAIWMHRLILNTPEGMDTDHINGSGLDNHKANLRICTRQKNSRNQKPIRGGSSNYKGVHWNSLRKKWYASIKGSGPQQSLGVFVSETEAALAYNKAAIRLFGEFAHINSIDNI